MRLLWPQGRTVSFANTLLVMTSNVGSSAIAKGGGGLGFQLPTADADGGQYARVRSLVMDELKVCRAPAYQTWGVVSLNPGKGMKGPSA